MTRRGPGEVGERDRVWSHIIRLSYNPSSARSSVHEREFLLRGPLSVVRRKTEENSGLCLFICGSDFERIPKRALRTLTCEKRDFTKDGMIDSVCDLTFFLSLCEESYSTPRGRSFSEKSSERVYFYFLDSYRSI